MTRYRLRTFATLSLTGPGDEATLGKHGQQRRRLALLAVLAASGDRGRSRDQLHLLFWPDVSQERARHSLEQLLYAIRSSIDEGVFAGVNPVRLNPEVVASDVGDFNDAMARGDRETAVEMYQGPFLDGFFLPDAPEFEQWLVSERAGLANGYAAALEELAQAAASTGDSAAAIRWWTRLTEADPVSGKYATGLMRALADAGDHSAALKFGERHEATVKRELGTGVGASVAAVAATVRAEADQAIGNPLSSQPLARPTEVSTLPVEVIDRTAEPVLDPTRVVAVPPDEPRHRALKPMIVAASLILLSAVATLGWLGTRERDSAAGDTPARSVAVLPFTNISQQPGDGPLVDGLSEDLTTVLTKIPNLRVIGRTSALALTRSGGGARRVADSLGISHLLEGSWQRIGSQLRVQVRLVDAADGSTRWSETYNREMRDIFSVQSDIAASVARELDLRLGSGSRSGIRRVGTENVAAYELYLRGNDPVMLRSDSASERALELLQQAIAIDPQYAAAYAGLSRLNMKMSREQESRDPKQRAEHLARAVAAALKAVALDDSSGDAHAALSMVKANQYNFAAAEEEMKRAIALEPNNARFREWLAGNYTVRNRPEEALVESRRAFEIDPLSATARAAVAHSLLALDRCDEALTLLEPLRSLRPPLLRAKPIWIQCYARKKMWAKALGETAYNDEALSGLSGYVLARAGRTGEAREVLTRLIERSRKISGGSFDVALVYIGLGQKREAVEWLEKSVEDRSLFLTFTYPTVNELQGDKGYERFRQRIGL